MKHFSWLALGLLLTSTPAVPCFMHAPQPVHLTLDHIEVNIEDQVATKTYNCHFFNPNPQAVVGGQCYMEVEPGAQVDKMSLSIDGKEIKAEILEGGKAKQVFTDIVKNGGSPALLEFYGSNLIQSNVPRIEPNGTVIVKLQYTTVLENRGGLIRLQMLNTNPKALMQPLKKASIAVNIKSKKPIKNVYSPTHPIRIVETKDADVAVRWEEENYLPRNPLVLYYALSDDAIGANILATKTDTKGHFMVMLSPAMGSAKDTVETLPKDIVFCVDTSRSMIQDGKMEQAREALKHCLRNLRDGDRFNIVDFGTEAHVWEKGMIKADAASRERALKHADGLVAEGVTAIEEALRLSISQFEETHRLKMIFFATDGLPTLGERDADKLAKIVRDANTHDIRLFTFGEGYDVNVKLLDVLALDNRGTSDYILPKEDIKGRISEFYDRVGSPVLTDLKIDFGDLKVDNVYPKQLPDLFKGDQVIVFGRYEGGGEMPVTLTAKVNGEERKFAYTLNFPKHEERSDYVARLWGGKKVAHLLDEVRKNGPAQELIDEIVSLAKQYGIVTPYTSYLVTEDIATMPASPGRWKGDIAKKIAQDSASGYGAASPVEARKGYVEEAERLTHTRENKTIYGLMNAGDKELAAHGGGGSAMKRVRYIADRTFYEAGGRWYDAKYDAAKDKPRKIKARSDEYFKLLDENPAVAKFLALGSVTLEWKGEMIEIEG